MRKLSLFFALLIFAVLPICAQVNPITGNITTSAACQATTSSACVIQRLPVNTSSVAVTTSGTFSGTLAPEQSADSGNTWTSAGSNITSGGVTTYTITAQNVFRVRASAFSSGTATVTINYSTAASGGSGSPTGAAGGALSGTYPNPTAGTSIAPNQNVIYVSPNCGTQTNCFTATADDLTDNATLFANLSTYVNALSRTTVSGQTVTSPSVYFAAGTYKYSSGLSFTLPVTIKCEPGSPTFLDYSGTAHAMDLGPAGLNNGTVQTGYYTVLGCGFIGGGSMTEGIYLNQWLASVNIKDNTFRNFGLATSTVYPIYSSGDTWQLDVRSNTFLNDDNVARKALFVANNGDGNTQLHFVDNVMNLWPNAYPSACGTSAGSDGWVVDDGYGSEISGNNFGCGAVPAVRVGPFGSHSRLLNNYYEELASGSTTPVITYGTNTSGGTVDGLIIRGAYANMHSSTVGFLGPANGTALLTNSDLENLRLTFFSASQPPVTMNNIAGQNTNRFGDVKRSTSITGIAPVTFDKMNTTGSALADWFTDEPLTFKSGTFTTAQGSTTFWTGNGNTVTADDVCAVLDIFGGNGSAGTITLTLTWSDAISTFTHTQTTTASAIGNGVQFCTPVNVGGLQSVTWSTTFNSVTGTPQYVVYLSARELYP